VISAYGDAAQIVARRMPDIDAIVTDVDNLPAAYLEALRRRQAGEAFYGLLLTDDPYDRVLAFVGPAILAETADDDQRRQIFTRIAVGTLAMNGESVTKFLDEPAIRDEPSRRFAAEFFLLCPALLVRSSMEERRLAPMFPRMRPLQRAVFEPVLPDVVRRPSRRPTVVVWAPERAGASIAYLAFALGEIQADRVLVTADGRAPAGVGDRAVAPDDPALGDILAVASCIAIGDPCDPGAAVAFARRGYGIVAPASTGASDYVCNASVYDPRVFRQLFVATATALAQPGSLFAEPPVVPRRPPSAALPMPRERAPLVSIVVPTFNRREELAGALACIGAQSYPNLEAVVVNDAGDPVADVVAKFPFARLLDLATNGGVNRAMMRGLADARGTYVQFLADDDRLYPDHVERLVAGMLAAGASIAHGNVMIHYLEKRDDGTIASTGYNGTVFVDTVTPTEALIASPVAGHALMWERAVFEEIGPWREDCSLADQEVQLRAAQRYAFVWIDQMTAEWRIRGSENFSSKTNALPEQVRIYTELHPTQRPVVVEMRERILTTIRDRPAGFVFMPTVKVSKRTVPASGARS
jgi:hypothetical protein